MYGSMIMLNDDGLQKIDGDETDIREYTYPEEQDELLRESLKQYIVKAQRHD
jgi:hypothetical protein